MATSVRTKRASVTEGKKAKLCYMAHAPIANRKGGGRLTKADRHSREHAALAIIGPRLCEKSSFGIVFCLKNLLDDGGGI